MAEGGGTGITTMPVLQSLAQARDRDVYKETGLPVFGLTVPTRSADSVLADRRGFGCS